MTKQLLVVENLDINFELHEKTVMSALKWQRAKHWLWLANPVRASR